MVALVKVVDLFAGCGGLSEGFIQNGFNLLAANEFDASVFETNKLNHSKYASLDKFILGDITKEETKNRIYEACGDNQVDVILGGPPCQGFSYAGWRDPNDQRNQLFRDFVDIVTTLKPKFFVMENVPGILTMRKGEAIKEKHKEVFDSQIDLLIVDETHYGARATEYGKVLQNAGLTKAQIKNELKQ